MISFLVRYFRHMLEQRHCKRATSMAPATASDKSGIKSTGLKKISSSFRQFMFSYDRVLINDTKNDKLNTGSCIIHYRFRFQKVLYCNFYGPKTYFKFQQRATLLPSPLLRIDHDIPGLES